MEANIERFEDYAVEAHKTAMYPEDKAIEYLALGLAGEAGEVANKVKKIIRGDKNISNEEIIDELGDVLWYLSELSAKMAKESTSPLAMVASRNIQKLKSRAERGVIKGNGDNR
ncbi:MAG: nucleoside triphosphate pyrophosphohydrolase family protein [Candidatus Micrarchaeaceae archaeon]